MCGRARLSSDVSEIKSVFGIPPDRPMPKFAANWNVAPTSVLPVVRFDPEDHFKRTTGAQCISYNLGDAVFADNGEFLTQAQKDPYHPSGQISQIKIGGMRTAKEIHEICGREQQMSGENLHC